MSANRLDDSLICIDQLLAGQMQIDESGIVHRKRLFGIDAEVCRRMASVRALVTGDHSAVLNTLDPFPSEMTPETVQSTSGGRRQRTPGHRRRYLDSLFSGQYDFSYVASRLRIGYRYARMDINMAVYIAGLRQLSETLRGLVPSSAHPALERMLAFDNALILECWSFVISERMKQDMLRIETEAAGIRERCSRLEEQVRQDPLTRLLNVRSLQEILAQETRRVHRTGQPLCVLYIDIDNFKCINDTYGHGVGDEVLRTAARVLRSHTRATDYVFRCGGDEFCVVAIDTVRNDADRLVVKLVHALQSADARLLCSIGVAELLPGCEVTVEQLLEEADRRMYACKHSGAAGQVSLQEIKAG